MALKINKVGTYTDAKGPNAKVNHQGVSAVALAATDATFALSLIAESFGGSIQGHMGIKIQRVGGDGAVIYNGSVDGEVATPAAGRVVAGIIVQQGASDTVTVGDVYGSNGDWPHVATITLTPGNYKITAKFSGFCDLNNYVRSRVAVNEFSDFFSWYSALGDTGSAAIAGKGGGQIVEQMDITITA